MTGTLVPLQLVDSVLLNYNVGDVLLLLLGLSILAALALRSRKALASQIIGFGLILVMTPGSALQPGDGSLLGSVMQYKFFGLVLLLAGPVLYTTAKRSATPS
ncbi:conserved hypothetical protein [Halorhabdus utahensis DSM 12940]|uniref:DUF8006 domain-containing protein n=1 Tax=Halorhabdus utahensis (strain DSM 12940 / JCM 11049 / AX-2) TaxID=519442 RepID=C7NNP2_HALUD|nr:hypothetical protein [Halorhabdus utahensis]ACV11567.1 conserved hypothetical protein [Halorhabdus utahensis DSM 12940]